MHPLIQALFSQWEWRFAILLPLGLLAAIYTAGWFNVRRRRHGQSRLANYWRLTSYWIGMIVLLTSLMSPIDILGGQLFFMHMTQHLADHDDRCAAALAGRSLSHRSLGTAAGAAACGGRPVHGGLALSAHAGLRDQTRHHLVSLSFDLSRLARARALQSGSPARLGA